MCGARAERARASAKRCRAPRATAVDFASSDTPAFFSRVAIFSNCVSSAELVRQAFRPNERVRDARRSDPGAMAGDAPPGVSVRRQSGARPPSPRRSPRRSFDRLPDFPVRPPSRRARFLDVRCASLLAEESRDRHRRSRGPRSESRDDLRERNLAWEVTRLVRARRHGFARAVAAPRLARARASVESFVSHVRSTDEPERSARADPSPHRTAPRTAQAGRFEEMARHDVPKLTGTSRRPRRPNRPRRPRRFSSVG